jgi:methylenetetrahydrofolate dehydrogenase (NADP+)/methenyltetrahydrofolate cyclohydrolase
MQLLDGKVVASFFKNQIQEDINVLKNEGKRAPHLVAILVGDNPASKAYVASKEKTCNELGMQSSLITFSDTITEDTLIQKILELNNDTLIDGILVQLPLPKHINENNIINTIIPAKDVDGFHPISQGKMMLGLPTFLPATPYGVMLMLDFYKIETAGKHCVVIGRSNIVGTPMSILLSRNASPGNCTVTLTHSKTTNIKELCLQADIIVAAIGKSNFVTQDMVKQGAVIIDVGINRIETEETKSGYKLVGDVAFEEVKEKCSYITPVPGGVGLMTICALMKNTLQAYNQLHHG